LTFFKFYGIIIIEGEKRRKTMTDLFILVLGTLQENKGVTDREMAIKITKAIREALTREFLGKEEV